MLCCALRVVGVVLCVVGVEWSVVCCGCGV